MRWWSWCGRRCRLWQWKRLRMVIAFIKRLRERELVNDTMIERRLCGAPTPPSQQLGDTDSMLTATAMFLLSCLTFVFRPSDCVCISICFL
ncbi:hypothetical protein E2542_SST09536 [Spatholobus suberectus]|nr:hypothetical protein E2542_SST09536 [Spatholobus suberectus]